MNESLSLSGPEASAELLNRLRTLLEGTAGLDFAVLVGSRAANRARSDSDWDIAVQWHATGPWMQILGEQETLRRAIAETLNVTPDCIDLVDLARANLAMRASVAEDGRVLKGEDSLEWARFLTRTWRELEDFYWEQSHAS